MTTRTKSPVIETSLTTRKAQPLCESVRESLSAYFKALNGHEPAALYEFVLQEIEQPLLEVVMQRSEGNITKAADVLGLNRGTLRKKLKKYGLH